ncbi:MAG: fibronectin type III domain-containing protein [Candidatus Acidiferrales bacterium]
MFLFSLLLLACGVPGAPVPPTAKIPQPPLDLVGRQSGERVVLRWTLPKLHTDGSRLPRPPRLEVHRAFLDDPQPSPETFAAASHLAYALPGPVVAGFLHNDIVVFPDVLDATVLDEQAGKYAVYGIKAVNDKKQDAGFSNLVAVRVYPVPEVVSGLLCRVTERAIELRWTPPRRTSGGAPLEAIAGYQIYRSDSGEEGSYALHGTAASARYEDTQFRFGARYFYRVRTLAQYAADTVESESSASLEVVVRDLFPPPVPANLVAVGGAARVDLTWDASPAPDTAGYFLYRGLSDDVVAERVNVEAIIVLSFADTNVEPGATYYYAVAAVDRDGNESGRSAPVAATPIKPE